MLEALRRADKAGLVIASNKRLSQALVGSEEWRRIRTVFACWSGTMAAYEEPGRKLGGTIEYMNEKTGIRFVFPVPQEHQGKKDTVLVAEHPDFTLEKEGKTRVVDAKEVGTVPDFPAASENWYLGDPKYDIPSGRKVDGNNDAARYLWRIDKRVGFAARGSDILLESHGRNVVLLNPGAACTFGMAVEAAESGMLEASLPEESAWKRFWARFSK